MGSVWCRIQWKLNWNLVVATLQVLYSRGFLNDPAFRDGQVQKAKKRNPMMAILKAMTDYSLHDTAAAPLPSPSSPSTYYYYYYYYYQY